MKRNNNIKRKARGSYFWKEITSFGIGRYWQLTIPNTPVNKNIIDFLKDHPMNQSNVFKCDSLDNIKKRQMIQDGFLMGYLKPGDKIDFNDKNEMIING